MKKIVFKTTIKCLGCVEKIKPDMDKLQGIEWKANLTELPRQIIVCGENPNIQRITEAIKKNGFEVISVKSE